MENLVVWLEFVKEGIRLNDTSGQFGKKLRFNHSPELPMLMSIGRKVEEAKPSTAAGIMSMRTVHYRSPRPPKKMLVPTLVG